MAESAESRATSSGLIPGELASTLVHLAYLSSRRDWNTGRYADPGLSGGQSGEEIDRLLRSAHEKAFAEWLAYSLEQKRAGLESYFAGLDGPKASVLETRKRLQPYRLFVPLACDPAEEQVEAAVTQASVGYASPA